ncbi:bidirectional sugar transporter SWEET9 [Eucalyptus grandis]|uniref:bidirectional sugar transporter SWEET9 n=1 Tax=Eucalyptus grandis TaxID=71139 RepID=UPI00192EBBA8|nr:bidirectional sugar transporter SWEET9 [Eucalyptus grandis]
MAFSNEKELAFIFGLLGNIVSFLVFLAPIPTFYAIYKKKSSDGYQSIPYVVALSSASLLLFYGVLKTNATMIISINAIGIVIELTYLILFLIYASTKEKMYVAKLLLVFNVGGFGVMMALTVFLLKGPQRVDAVGWICAAFNLAVFAAPLSIMRRVIKTKSVEFMPFTLSFFLTLCATAWFFYGLFVKDMFIALPNTLGFLFGIAQMILYMIYKYGNKKLAETNKGSNQQEVSLDMEKMASISSAQQHPTSQHQPQVTAGKPVESSNV